MDKFWEAVGQGSCNDILQIDFRKALRFTLSFTLLILPLVIGVGLAIALAVNNAARPIRGSIIFVSLLPFIITPVIGSLSIYWLFGGDGILTATMERWIGTNISMFAQAWMIELLMYFYRVWHVAPFAFVIFYAGLQTVNMDTLESALIDGANRWERLRHVIIPHLMPLIIFVALIHLMDCYRVFEEIDGFRCLAHVISPQWLTYDFMTPAEGNRTISRGLCLGHAGNDRDRYPAHPAAAQDMARSQGERALMSTSRAMQQSFALRVSSGAFLAFWCLLAAFPIFWIAIMSFKSPVDAFAASPWDVMTGPATCANGDGLSFIDIAAGLVVFYFAIRWAFSRLPGLVRHNSPPSMIALGWIFGALIYGLAFVLIFFGALPLALGPVNALLGPLGDPILGLTTEHYRAVWVENEFYRSFLNFMLVTAGVLEVSLTVGTLAGYGLARSGSSLAFWLLFLALVFRALPHSVLVAGYLPVFVNSSEILQPVLGDGAPTLYGQPWVVIAVLVAINQPFTIWMLRSFFRISPRNWTKPQGWTCVRIFRPFAGSSCRSCGRG